MSASLLVMAYAFSDMCSFVLSLSFNMSSLFPSWDNVSPFVLIGSTHKPVVGSLPPPDNFVSIIDSEFMRVVDYLTSCVC